MQPLSTPQIAMIPLTDLVVPSWNPRKFIDPTDLANLADFISNGGRVPRILVLRQGDQWAVVSGQRRVEAYRRLKLAEVEAEVLDITLAEAKVMAETSNEGIKPYWLDSYENWETLLYEDPDRNQRDLARRLGKPKSAMNRAIQLMAVLNPASRALIRQTLAQAAGSVPSGDNEDENKKNSWQLVERVAEPLTALLSDRSPLEAQTLVEKALPVVLKRQMTGPQVRQLIDHLRAGKPLEEFGGHKPAPKAPKANAAQTNTPSIVHTDVPMAEAKTVPSKSAPQPVASEQKPGTFGTGSHTGTGATQAHTSAGSLGVGEAAAWDILAGLPVATQIRAKIKKGERPSLAEALILLVDLLWRGFLWVGKHGYKLGLWLLKELFKMFKEGIKNTLRMFAPAVAKTVKFVFSIVIFCAALWFIWDIYNHGPLHPFELVVSKIHFGAKAEEPKPVPAIQPVAPVSQLTNLPTTIPTPIQPAVTAIAPSQPAKAAVVTSKKVAQAKPAQVLTPQPKGDLVTDVAKNVNVGAAAGDVVKSLIKF